MPDKKNPDEYNPKSYTRIRLLKPHFITSRIKVTIAVKLIMKSHGEKIR